MAQSDENIPVSSIFSPSSLEISLPTLVHVVSFLALCGFMAWNRLRHYSQIISPDGEIIFPSADAWYHRRTTRYTVENYPSTLPFDPFTAFDTGNFAGQFGTVYDQFLATIALVAGAGNPSTTTVDLVLAFTPPILGVLTTIPIYYLGKEMSGKWGALVAVGILALAPGLFLSRSLVGFADHHVAETLLVATSLYLMAKTTTVGYTSRLSSSSLRTGNWNELRPFAWPVLAGFVNAIYLLVWPPGIFYIGILGLFIGVQIVIEYLIEQNPQSLASVYSVSMITTGLATAPYLDSHSLSATSISYAQVGLPVAISLAAFVLATATRRLGGSTTEKGMFLGTIGGGTAILGVLSITLFPEQVAFFIQKSDYVLWFVDSGSGMGVAEATSLQEPFYFGFVTYGFALLTAVGGWGLMLFEGVKMREQQGRRFLVVIFGFFIASATVSQVRFDYYLVIAVSIFTGYLVSRTFEIFKTRWRQRDVGDAILRARLVAGIVVLVVVAPFVLSGSPVVAADNYAPSEDADGWSQTLDWLGNETPAPGAYGTGDEPRLDYTGAYRRVDDFDYQTGEYGIMSQWDVGHRITVEAHRIPVSNPHQQHTTVVANTLLSPSERRALSEMDSGVSDGSGVQYIVLGESWGTGNDQTFVNPVWSETAFNTSAETFRKQLVARESGRLIRNLQTARSYRSLRTRLYQFHGSAVEPSRLVVYYNTSPTAGQVTLPNGGPVVREFETANAAAKAAAEDPRAVHGGLYGESPVGLQAVEHFRLVFASNATVPKHPEEVRSRAPVLGNDETSEVKAFERVPGATISGTGPANATVRAQVELRVTTTGETFTYTQYAETTANGTFSLTVPYATTGYSEYTTSEGYTNTSVRATGPYTITVQDAQSQRSGGSVEVEVPEAAIIGETDEEVVVSLQNQTRYSSRQLEITGR